MYSITWYICLFCKVFQVTGKGARTRETCWWAQNEILFLLRLKFTKDDKKRRNCLKRQIFGKREWIAKQLSSSKLFKSLGAIAWKDPIKFWYRLHESSTTKFTFFNDLNIWILSNFDNENGIVSYFHLTEK